jgi:flagellar biosynthetic protein FlhB
MGLMAQRSLPMGRGGIPAADRTMASNNGDKTEAPTPKKRAESRKKGMAARSSELPQAISLVASAIAIPSLFPRFLERSAYVWRSALDPAAITDPAVASHTFAQLLLEALRVFVPLVAIATTASVVSQLALSGGRPNPHKLKPQWKNLNPAAGFKRMFSMQILWDLGRTVAKIALMAAVGWSIAANIQTDLLDGSLSLSATLDALGLSLRDLLVRTASLALLIGFADAAYNRRRFTKQLKMTKQEVIDEHKQGEVNPHVKAEIRRRQATLSRSRMMAAVAGADVVITNPTHLAIALKYEPGDAAPTVVAKGAGVLARRIREEARTNGVPIRENKPLARSMYRAVDVGQQIPAEFFAAVAAVLAAVYRARRRRIS